MFSNENAKQADMCRFCWMCRHICPVAGATGSEGWGPRARGLMVSMIERGTEYDAEIADAMYHCTMCDACANDCVTGWKPTDFTREARMYAVTNDIAPSAIMTEIDNIMNKGNIFGLDIDANVAKAIDKLPTSADVLLLIGQSGRTVAADTALAVMNIMDKAGVKYTAIKDEKPTGALLGDIMGFTGDVQTVAKAAAKDIENTGAKTVVCLSPYDAVMLKEKYSEWQLLKDIDVVSAPKFVASLVEDKKINVKKITLSSSLQEPVKLTRGLDEISPLLSLVDALGVDYKKLFLNGKMSRCIGTSIMECFDSKVVEKMVEVRLDDARRIGSNAIITASTDDTYLMKKYAANDVIINDIFVLLSENI